MELEEKPILVVIGHVESPLTDPSLAPKQGREEGDEVIVLTWLDRADRKTLRVHPRDDASRPLTGVFSTRSADRPNPIGLHRVRIVSIEDGLRFQVHNLEAVDGTPILDVKPVLGNGEAS
jgi:tRNA-Thr(GGU) m(6)t(6)A37 methyltransferase TsaA